MPKWVGLSCFVILFILVASILCVRLNSALSDNQLARYRLEAAQKHYKAAEVELQAAQIELKNALYRRWLLNLQYKGLNLKGNWEEDLENLKKENGFYD